MAVGRPSPCPPSAQAAPHHRRRQLPGSGGRPRSGLARRNTSTRRARAARAPRRRPRRAATTARTSPSQTQNDKHRLIFCSSCRHASARVKGGGDGGGGGDFIGVRRNIGTNTVTKKPRTAIEANDKNDGGKKERKYLLLYFSKSHC